MISERCEWCELSQFNTVPIIFVCNRCNLQIDSTKEHVKWTDRVSVRFTSGYKSIFGTGNVIEGSFCQTCIEEVLGNYLRINMQKLYLYPRKYDEF